MMMKATIFQLKINEYRKNRSNCRTKNYLKTSAQLTIHKDGATDDDSVTAYRLIEGARPLDEDDRAAVRRRVIEGGDSRLTAKAVSAPSYRSLVAAEVEVLARERPLVRECGNPVFVE